MSQILSWIIAVLLLAGTGFGAVWPSFGQTAQQSAIGGADGSDLVTYPALSLPERDAVDAWRRWVDQGVAGRNSTGEERSDEYIDGLRQKAMAADTEFERELFTRAARDQFMRFTLPPTLADKRLKLQELGHTLSDEQLVRVQEVMHREAFSMDIENAAWLERAFDANGREWWPISEIGEDASFHLWLLVQHADHDPAFQRKVLAKMEPMIETDEVDKGSYAYLYDRVMSGAGQAQRYGTQLECRDGRYQPKLLEDEEGLEALRASVGLGPIADYLGMPRFDPAHCDAPASPD
ncbi:hypothetical protein D1224_03195 [Henriciella barbarensis]|uniref:Uncharacterized protein n=1 Tax=Henriciella barbarensis TaxID=86342 RepID=A0A399QYT9_9PROT|nr:DUF6624 domain-containing protein [Henriciella barbarensis]RIJ23295.1 hypothetical protein D1224_03195 [Henriciella barbarensis]